MCCGTRPRPGPASGWLRVPDRTGRTSGPSSFLATPRLPDTVGENVSAVQLQTCSRRNRCGRQLSQTPGKAPSLPRRWERERAGWEEERGRKDRAHRKAGAGEGSGRPPRYWGLEVPKAEGKAADGQRCPSPRGADLHPHGVGQQHAEPLRELLERVADGEARLADVHGLHHARVSQLPQAQLPVKQLWADTGR